MYFQNFKKIYYDFDTKDNDKSLRILTDITTNVRVRKKILENITLYEEYDIQEGETPELIAEKFYGNPEFHWIIMLLNERYDHIEDFPINQDEIEDYTKSVYGEDNIYEIHHYEKNSITIEAKATLKVNPNTFIPASLYKINDYLITDNTIARIDSINNSNSTLLISLTKGSFKANELVNLWGFRENEETKQIQYSQVALIQLQQNPFTLNETYTAVTNLDHIISENEKKRKIKILSPELLSQVLQELEDLLIK